MAAALNSVQIQDLSALASLEEQAVYVAQYLLVAQGIYNVANPTSQRQAVSIQPDFSGGSISVQMVLPLEAGAIGMFPTSSVGTAF